MTEQQQSREVPIKALSGWFMVISQLIYLALLITTIVVLVRGNAHEGAIAGTALPGFALFVAMIPGFFVVNPNMSRVLVLFGNYRGTVRQSGFYWTNPFTVKHKLSLRAHNIASQTIKVNDLDGNPIEIGAVVVWQVRDSAQATFDVEDYVQYVDVQIESAVRQMAKVHPYDDTTDSGVTSLRGDTDEVTVELQRELQMRLERAGILVLESRISHLAYAPEIASAMLQRQQASAIVAAREKIVEGAVGMVEQALNELSRKEIVELDAERRATMVGNLMVVLCGQAPATPVLNTGSLYT